MEMKEITAAVREAAVELLTVAQPRQGKILVIGCSTSEVAGAKIGTAGTLEVARAILIPLRELCRERGLHLAIQCCEHLNRALVVERVTQELFQLEEVSVVPVCGAGGALATQAMADFAAPVVVETIRADVGLDIGNTMIGMHLRPVAVPVRLTTRKIGKAQVAGGYSRPKLIGGARAVYDKC